MASSSMTTVINTASSPICRLSRRRARKTQTFTVPNDGDAQSYKCIVSVFIEYDQNMFILFSNICLFLRVFLSTIKSINLLIKDFKAVDKNV